MPAHPEISSKQEVQRRKKSCLRIDDFMIAFYMKNQDGEGGEKQDAGKFLVDECSVCGYVRKRTIVIPEVMPLAGLSGIHYRQQFLKKRSI